MQKRPSHDITPGGAHLNEVAPIRKEKRKSTRPGRQAIQELECGSVITGLIQTMKLGSIYGEKKVSGLFAGPGTGLYGEKSITTRLNIPAL
jgi:hypothetical protein